MRDYIEDWGKYNTKNKRQYSKIICLDKYCCLNLCDEYINKTFFIDNKEIHYDENDGCNSILINEEPYGSLTVHE